MSADFTWLDEIATWETALQEWQEGDLFLYETIGNKWRAAVVESVNRGSVAGKTYDNGAWHTFSILPTNGMRFVCNLKDYGL